MKNKNCRLYKRIIKTDDLHQNPVLTASVLIRTPAKNAFPGICIPEKASEHRLTSRPASLLNNYIIYSLARHSITGDAHEVLRVRRHSGKRAPRQIL